MKLKDNITIPAFKFRLTYLIAGLFLIVFIILTTIQFINTKELKKENKIFKKQNKELTTTNLKLLSEVQADSIKIASAIKKVDSLKQSDAKYKQQIYLIKKRYEKLKIDYASATNSERNRIFTNLINN